MVLDIYISIQTYVFRGILLVAKSKFIIWSPVIGLSILFAVLYTPEFLGINLWLSYTERMNLILTVALAMFAAIEAYSTYLQVELENKKNMINDAKNELEKAYGPLFAILNKFELGAEMDQFIYLTNEEKIRVDEVMATYPFMFPSDINNLWKKINQKPDAVVRGDTLEITDYKIPTEFRDKINEEYDRRVKKYNKLVNKEKN